MPIDLYYMPGSAPCRAVLLTAKALGLDLNLKLTDLMKGDNLSPDYVKINPQHTIPTLVDDGFILWESRPIMTYLVDQYGKNDSLYPKNPKKRALVDQRLYFDMGTLYARFADYYYPVVFAGCQYDPAKLEKIKEAFSFLDMFLEKNEFVAGNQLTVADLSILASLASYDVMGFKFSNYKNVASWFCRVRSVVPGYEEINAKGALAFKKMADKINKKKLYL